MATMDELDFVAWMAQLASENRDLYRRLREEAWQLVQENHAAKSNEARERWNRAAS